MQNDRTNRDLENADTTGNRSWAKHPTQNLPWMMGVQVEALARGK